ncbi:YqjK-like family protein [Pantoea sp. BAV 3049]|uniref:YqjK-like family protein n=1 Tax=Pantoea sp. BAV 3049 TaxID=2654188 RepID=UPI00131B2330|nr:YqjK-like family protein [Pantoea sp. BAV 3049]
MSRERDERKAELLRQVQQQRLDLSADRNLWLERTARYDHGWLTLVGLRRYVAVGSGLMAIWSVRNPRFITRWAKRGFGVWSTWRVVRNYLPRR